MVELGKDEQSRSGSPDGADAPPEFLSLLAHELRNPLAPIRNGTELLRSICSDPRQLQVVEMMSRQVVHLTRLLDDLLDAARLRRGLLTLKKQNVDVSAIVHQALETVRPAIDARKQSLLVSLPADSVSMHCDPVRLVQVLQNLLDNANRYTADAGSISLRADVDGGVLTFEVSDSGVGIEPELLPKLFNVFAQGGQQLHRPKGGLGLGLAIARNLVEMHGGTITADSAGHGTGSRFTVRLPIEHAKAVVGQTPAEAANDAPVTRVLIIDDNDVAAATLAQYLIVRGHEVLSASSGEQGLELAARFHPQAVIIDVGLPGIDGFEVARRLRLDPATASAVLIALSGYSPDMLRHADMSLFARYLVKPAAPESIATLIEQGSALYSR